MTKSKLKNKLRRGLTLLLGLAFAVPQMLPATVFADEAEATTESAEIEEQGNIFLDLSEGGTVTFELDDGSQILYEKQQDGNITMLQSKTTKTLKPDKITVLAYTGAVGEEVTVRAEAKDGYKNLPVEVKTANGSQILDDSSQVVQISSDDTTIKVSFTETEDSKESTEEESDDDEESDIHESDETSKADETSAVATESEESEEPQEEDDSQVPDEEQGPEEIVDAVDKVKEQFGGIRLTAVGPSRENAKMTIDEWLGTDRTSIVSWLSSHENDDYYLGTHYSRGSELGFGWNPTGECRPYGRYKDGTDSMNCAGFVADAVIWSGGTAAKRTAITNRLKDMVSYVQTHGGYSGSGSYINASYWNNFTVDNPDIKCMWFDSIEEALASKKLRKGDIIYFEPRNWGEPDSYGNYPDCHIGFYWGSDYSGEDKFWHSAHGSDSKGHPMDNAITDGNQMTRLAPKCESSICVIPLSDDVPYYGEIEIQKNKGKPQGDATLKGIEITVTNRSGETIKVKDGSSTRDVGNNKTVMKLTLDAKGKASTGEVLPYGTYELTETKANDWYEINDDFKETVVIGANGSDPQPKKVTIDFDDPIKKAGLAVYKVDQNLKKASAQGDATLAGAVYTVTNKSKHAVTVDGKSYEPGKVITSIELVTNAKGKASVGAKKLPLGTYEVTEKTPSEGYLLPDPNPVYTVTLLPEDAGTVKDVNKETETEEPVIRGGVKFGKIDAERNEAVSQGQATLKGAEITIYNDSENDVFVDGKPIAPGKAVMVLTTDKKGLCGSDPDALPYGTYAARETKASEGYLINEEWSVSFSIRENGVVIDKSEKPLPEQVIRGDIYFRKVNIDGEGMPGIPFMISRLDEKGNVVESHVIVSDKNGVVSTKDRSKIGKKVNSLDHYAENGVFTDDDKLDGTAGIWFGEQEAKSNDKGALLYADYRIEELRCKANEGQDLLKTEQPVQIREDQVEVLLSNELVDLNIQLSSKAMDVFSDSKTVTLGKEVSLCDTVSYTHLKTYSEYELVTTFYNVHKDGTAVKLASESMTFIPEKTDNTKTAYGEISNTVTVDTSKVEPGSIVAAMDELYKIEGANKILVASHNTDYSAESQKLFVPEMKTEASDSKTKDHVGTAEVEASIADILKYKNLADNKIYQVTAKLRDAETGEEVAEPVTRLFRINYKATEVTQKTLYWQGPKDGTLIMPAFNFDASAMEGRTLVVTETLTDMDSGAIILTHEALDDTDQQVHYIRVRTEAKDGITESHVGTVTEKATVIDQVTIENAVIGETYVITGSLVYQEDCTDADGVSHKAGEIIAEHEPVEVVAEDTTIVKDLVFSLDASKLEGISGTVFEDVYHKNILVGTHHDIHSEPQTVSWPKVRTTATDGETKTHTGVVGEKATIIDEVQLTNLVVGETYKVQGTLKTSEGADFLADGKALVIEHEFNATAREMTIPMEFTFNSSELKGQSLVVFEKLFYKDAEVARHEDKDDKGQTISYPDGKTNAADSGTKDQVGMVTETDTIIDTVSYHNLVVGETYTIKGQPMYKEPFIDADNRVHETGEPVLDKEGKPITAETTFEAKEQDGTVDLIYTLDSSLLKGSTVVVFEDIYSNGVKVFSHADLEDEDQSVWYPSVRTMAIDTVTKDHVGTTGHGAVIQDTVELKNLKVGETYKVYGTLMDKETGDAVVDANGANITAESDEFVAESRDMTITMKFTLDASIRENMTTVVFEELIHKDVVVAAHAEIGDEEQSIHHPAVHTTATDEETGEHVGRAREKTVIHDTVKMYNLIPGMTYELEGYLVDSDSGKPYLDVDGKEVRVHTKPFTAERGKENTEMILTFTFNGSNLKGKSITVFEDLYHDGHIVAAHRLKNDKDQMVDYPEIHTMATDKETSDHISGAGEKATIIDEVTYTNLRPGLTYKVKGVLMNKQTGKSLEVNGEKITAEKEFTPEKKDGSVKLAFTFDASALAGETVVVFEDVYYNEIGVAAHHDIEDEDQTVVIPKVQTSVKDEADGDRLVDLHKEITLVDSVSMENLKPGEKYIIRGVLMNKRTGEALMEEGSPVIADSGYFTADSTTLNQEVKFIFNTNKVEDVDLVVFEKLYIIKNGQEIEVGSHENMDDKNQTIHVKPDRDIPKTGDKTKVLLPLLVMIGSLAGLIFIIWRKRKLG